MVIFGLLLLLLGVILVLAGVFGTDYDHDTDDPTLTTTEFLGWNMGPEAIFVIGAVGGALVLLGIWTMKAGTARSWKRRKEDKRLGELHEKLERHEAERRRDEGDDSTA